MTPGKYIRARTPELVALERIVIGLGMKSIVIVYDDKDASMASLEPNRDRLAQLLADAAVKALGPETTRMEITPEPPRG